MTVVRGATMAEPDDRPTFILTVESGTCRNCDAVIERFVYDGDERGTWHHLTGTAECGS